MTQITKMEKELLSLIDKNSSEEREKVERYYSLVKISRKLDKSIKNDGAMIKVVNGGQSFLKVNPAISEKVKVNGALIKLGEFFDRKRMEKSNKNEVNFEDFI